MPGRHILFLPAFLLIVQQSAAQFYNMPGDYFFSLPSAKQLAAKESETHSNMRPFVHFFSPQYTHVADSHRVYKYIKNDPALDAFFYKHLIRIEPTNENFRLRLDPLVNFEFGKDYAAKVEKRLYTNTRGFIGCGHVGNSVYFESLFAENQSFVPDYLAGNFNATKVVPGQGRWKSFKTVGYDYAFTSGFVSVQLARQVNLQAGHGKQKIGHGYRSLLLSDNSFNYPYARITHQWFKGKLQYSNIYAVLMNLVPSSAKQPASTERLFQKKAASFHYLSLNLGKSLNLGLFQGLVWQAGDARNRHYLDWRYFNPVIYTSLVNQPLNAKNNFLIGGTGMLKLGSKLQVYAQCMADDLSNTDTLGNGWGYQAGINYFDAFGINNLFLQAEFNTVSEGAYRNKPGIKTDQSYSHYGQNLAYTPGYGQELVLIADYRQKRWMLSLKYNYQQVPQNGKEYYNNSVFNARVGYLINPSYNLNACIGYSYRNQNFYNFKTLNNETGYFFVGLRTSLYNIYYDF